jgi:hypothetical protein
MTPFQALLLLLLPCAVSAFISTSITSRDVVINSLPTSLSTVTFVATNTDSQGTFNIGQCSALVVVQAPTFNFVTVPAGNVPRDVVPVTSYACVVTSVDDYRRLLESQGETLNLVYDSDGDLQSIIAGNSTQADFRRRLLQVGGGGGPDAVTSFGASSKITSAVSRQSLSPEDALQLQLLNNYQRIDQLQEQQIVAGVNVSRLTIDALNMTLDMIALLEQRGQNTDAAVSAIGSFAINAYNQLSFNISQLYAAQNASNAATLALFNGLLAFIQTQQPLSYQTSQAIQGLLDLRVADKSEWQAWIDQDEIKDLATALYFNDLQQIPDTYVPFVRHPGVQPMGTLVGPDSRVLIDEIDVNTVWGYQMGLTGSLFPHTGIAAHRFKVYADTEYALTYDLSELDPRVFVSMLGPAGCIPPYQDLQYSQMWFPSVGTRRNFPFAPTFTTGNQLVTTFTDYWMDYAQLGNGSISASTANRILYTTNGTASQNVYAGYNQTFNFNASAPTCDIWVDVTLCECSSTPSSLFLGFGSGQWANFSSFRWSGYAPFLSGDQNLSAACAAQNPGYNLWCINTIATDIDVLNHLLILDFCPYSLTPGVLSTSISQLDPYYLTSYRTQLRAQTLFGQYSNSSSTVTGCTGIAMLPPFGNINSQISQIRSGQISPTMAAPLYHFLALLTAGFEFVQSDIAALRLKKFGRLAGVETTSIPTNLFTATQYDQFGNVVYDGAATPLYCQQAKWNAYATETLPVTNFQANAANLVTTNITVTLTCPPCTDPDSCYAIPSVNITQDVQSISPGAFALNSNFLVLGDPNTWTMTELYDVPPEGLVISPVIESRSFTPLYSLLPVDVTTTPNFTVFETYGERNTFYSAQYGTVSPQAYVQTLLVAPNGCSRCSPTGRVAGAQWCSILDEFCYTYSNATGLAQFQDSQDWNIRFSITMPSGLYYDTVDIGNECPLTTLRPVPGGGLFLVLQNDASVFTQVVVSWSPVNNSVGISCPSPCCNPNDQISISPRYVQYVEIPVCPFVELGISVQLVNPDLSTIQCFQANGTTLANQIQSASTVLGLNGINSFNYTEVYASEQAALLTQRAYEAILLYMEQQASSALVTQELLDDLTASRDRWQQQLVDIQVGTGFTPTIIINTTDLEMYIGGLLTNNTLIDADISATVIAARDVLGVASNITDYILVLGQQVQEILDEDEILLEEFKEALANSESSVDWSSIFKYAPNLKNLFDSSDGECPGGFFDALLNTFKPNSPGIFDYLGCIMDDIITAVITILVVIIVLALIWYCGPSILGMIFNHMKKSAEEMERKDKEKGKPKYNKLTKKSKKNKEKSSDDEEDEEEAEEGEGDNEDEDVLSSTSSKMTKRYVDD